MLHLIFTTDNRTVFVLSTHFASLSLVPYETKVEITFHLIAERFHLRNLEHDFVMLDWLYLWCSIDGTSITLVKRVYGAWELVCLPLLSLSIHNEQRQVNIALFFNIWLKTVNNLGIYCIYNLNNPPIVFFVSNITFSGVRIFTRNIYFNCTDISDTGVQMFLRTNDKIIK